jgi:hypothetical protein
MATASAMAARGSWAHATASQSASAAPLPRNQTRTVQSAEADTARTAGEEEGEEGLGRGRTARLVTVAVWPRRTAEQLPWTSPPAAECSIRHTRRVPSAEQLTSSRSSSKVGRGSGEDDGAGGTEEGRGIHSTAFTRSVCPAKAPTKRACAVSKSITWRWAPAATRPRAPSLHHVCRPMECESVVDLDRFVEEWRGGGESQRLLGPPAALALASIVARG